mgnify:CR=1 FL=1
MSQPISVSVQMDAASFHDFAAFDLLRHHKAWHRPLVFTAILLVSAGVCLSQVGQKDGAALLTVLLAVVALGVPAVYFWTFSTPCASKSKRWACPASSTGCCWTTKDCRSGWPASRTSLRRAASMRGTICIWPTAPPTPFTSMSGRIRPIC